MRPPKLRILRMNMTTHTPKRWTLKIIGSYAQVEIPGEIDDGRITLNIPANARLIAAAPELLEALETILPHLDDMRRLNEEHSRMFWKVKSAIAKAKGT